MRLRISLCRFHENSVRKMLHEKKGVNPWDEFTHCKAVSQKVSFWFFSEDISFSTIDFCVFPNIPSQSPQKQWYQTALSTESFTSMRWMHTSQRSFSDNFSPVFYLKILPFSTLASFHSWISLCIFHKKSVTKLFNGNKDLTLWDQFTHHKTISQKVSF